MLNALGKDDILYEKVCDAGDSLVLSQNSPLCRINQQVKRDPPRKHNFLVSYSLSSRDECFTGTTSN